jgi:hypothetical protein
VMPQVLPKMEHRILSSMQIQARRTLRVPTGPRRCSRVGTTCPRAFHRDAIGHLTAAMRFPMAHDRRNAQMKYRLRYRLWATAFVDGELRELHIQ